MYTDEDLNHAVEKGIFTKSSVAQFRDLFSSKNTSVVDEENFRLIGGFNDIFIVIACGLLLFSSRSVLNSFGDHFGSVAFIILSWCLAEYFVRKRKMALPAIVLMLTFVVGIYNLCTDLLPLSFSKEVSFSITAAICSIAAYLHWLRFQVPITIAVGTATVTGFLLASMASTFPNARDWLMTVLFICGIFVFLFAMYWDASDRNRSTRRSDVAFWLHLLSAPLIIHPVFTSLGILNGADSLNKMAIIIILYLLMTTISIAVDRRAFMVSSLIYVIYALTSLISAYGGVGYSFALTGVFMGGAILLLSAYWHKVRSVLVSMLPHSAQQYLPEISGT
ncbi:MAG: hypothetical protein AB8D52_13020 [Gammaproteobacteria bacterium]